MGIAIKKLFCELLFLMFEFLNTLSNLFKILCGTEVLDSHGEEMTLVDLFLNSSPIVTAFLGIFIISGIVIMISIMVAVIKKIIKDDGKRSHGQIAFQGLWAIISSLVMATVMFGGIFFSNTVLQLVDKATSNGGEATSISQQIFEMCLPDVAYDYKPVFKIIGGTVENPEYELDDDGNRVVVDWHPVPIEGGSFQPNEEGGYYSIEDITFGETTVDDVFGIRYKTLGLFESEDREFKQKPMVMLNEFNIFLGYFAVIMLIVTLVGSMLGLVKRVYDLVMLFLMLPLVSGVIPLDDGARFKSWQTSVVSKVLLAYGAVLSVNVFLLFLPVIMGLNIPGISKFGNNVFRLFLLVGGALSIKGGQLLMARVFGTSAEESREMAQSARALAAGAATAIHLPGRMTTAVLGQRMADGQGGYFRAGGLLGQGGLVRGTGHVLGGTANMVGNTFIGEAYRRPASVIAGVAGGATGSLIKGFRGLTHINRSPVGGSVNAQPTGGVNSYAPTNNKSGAEVAAAAAPSNKTEVGNPKIAGNAADIQPRTNPFKYGVVGATYAGMKAAFQAAENAIQPKQKNGLLKPLDTSKDNAAYRRPNNNGSTVASQNTGAQTAAEAGQSTVQNVIQSKQENAVAIANDTSKDNASYRRPNNNGGAVSTQSTGAQVAAEAGQSTMQKATQPKQNKELPKTTNTSSGNQTFVRPRNNSGTVAETKTGAQTASEAGKNVVQNVIQPKQNPELSKPTNTISGNPIYTKPKANFTPKTTSENNSTASKTQKESTATKNSTSQNTGVDSAINGAKNKSDNADNKKGKYKRGNR